MKRRQDTRELYVYKKLRVGGVQKESYLLPEKAEEVDNGKVLGYNHINKRLEFVDNPGQDVNADLKCRDLEITRDLKMTNADPNILIAPQSNLKLSGGKLKIENVATTFDCESLTIKAPFVRLDSNSANDIPYDLPTSLIPGEKYLKSDSITGVAYWANAPGQDVITDLKCRDLEINRDIKMTNQNPNIFIGSEEHLKVSGGKLTIENLQTTLSCDGLTIKAPFVRMDSASVNDIPYNLPTTLIPGEKFLKSDSNNGLAYWGDAPTQPTIGATNLAANWNWDYNQNFTLSSPTFTSILPVSISPTNVISNGYIINNGSNIYQTEVGSWGNHKFSINVNIEPVDSHDYPVRVYAIYFKSNSIAWNYLRNVMSLQELNIVAASSALGCYVLSEVVDRPHNGYLSMYGAGSFVIPEADKNIYTGYVQSYVASILHVSGNIISYGFPSNGITQEPSIDNSFSTYNSIFANATGSNWFFTNGISNATYALVNNYGARANSWVVLSATSVVGPPYNIMTTCLKVSSVDIATGSVTFFINQNYTDFVNSTGLLTNKNVLYVINNWSQPPVHMSNGYALKLTGLKTEIYQISPKGEAGEVGLTAIDDTQTTGNRTWSSTKINNNLNLKADTNALTSGLALKNNLITSSTTLNAAGFTAPTVSCDTLTSTSSVINFSRSIAMGTQNIACGSIAGSGSLTGFTANASIINAGSFDAARIPSLDTSKIVSGVLDVARIPTLPISQITNLGNSVTYIGQSAVTPLIPGVVNQWITPLTFVKSVCGNNGSGIIHVSIRESTGGNANRCWSNSYRFAYRRSDFSGDNSSPTLVALGAPIDLTNPSGFAVGAITFEDDKINSGSPYQVRLKLATITTSSGATGLEVLCKIYGVTL